MKGEALLGFREPTRELPAATASCGLAHCRGCYEVEPGVRLHPPRSGRGDGKTPDLRYKGESKC